jgi:nicotinamide phosphoribosyltransferase
MKTKVNTILMGDAYKYTHWMQYPKNTSKIYAYIESRGTKLDIPYTVFFGIQGFISDYLEGRVVEEWMIDEAKELIGEVFGTHQYFNEAGFRLLLSRHGGNLPIKIMSVKEGTKVGLKNVLVTIENTDPDFSWIVQWIETMLLRGVWYPKGVATISSAVKDIEKKYAEICGCDLNPFFLNDFGARGVSSHESAEIGGSAHLVNYLGTDTIEGIRWAKAKYGNTASGHSVFATEHSTTTIYKKENELIAYRHFLSSAPDDKIVSIVIDSYNTENAVKNLLGTALKDVILKRTAPTVFRPDSGDPIEMSLNVVSWLWDIFGGTVNIKGFKVLNPKVRVIYGDGINLNSIELILQNLINHKFSIENIMFGMGGKLLQSSVDRDTFMDACKVCFAVVDGIEIEVYKDPITDTGKKSKRGLLKLVWDSDSHRKFLKTVNISDPRENQLQVVFQDGKTYNYITFDEVRKNANHNFM